MLATIVRGRIRLTFPDSLINDEIADIADRLALRIGSARLVDKNPREISCALSIHNFRKLKRVNCQLSEDPATRATIANMRKQLDAYEEESKRAKIAKSGVELFSNYEFKKKPFPHQKIGFQFLHSMPNPALFGDCGVGKTFILVTYADSLLKAGVEVAFLVICPVNLIKHVWIDDSETFSDLRAVGLRLDGATAVRASDYDDKKDPELGRMEKAQLRASRRELPEWVKKAKRKAKARHKEKIDEMFGSDADMYIVNPENLRTDPKEKRVLDLCKRLIKEGKEICLVIDESSKVKTRTSRTYKSLKRIRSLASSCIIMTGTPSPNGILDLWAQFSILDNGMTLQPNYNDFRRDTSKEKVLRGKTYTDRGGNSHDITVWSPKPEAAMEVYRTIEPRMIRFKTEDCIDLPPQRFIMRYVDMTTDQEAFYREMEERLFAELEGEPVTARVAVAKLMKLREVTGGFIITDEGETKAFNKDAAKMLELDDLLEQSIADKLGDEGPPLKALIWCQYKWECKTIVERYRKKYGARGLFGGISSGAKERNIHEFKTSKSCRILVCHPASAGHGLTLTEANYAFYYSMSYNFEEFYQSYRRITRPGQKRSMTYYFLLAPNTIDEELIDAIRSKKNLSDIVTDGDFARDEFLGVRGSIGGQINFNWEDNESSTTST